MPVRKLRAGAASPDPGPNCRPIIEAPEGGWAQLAMGEWELGASSYADQHPHDEVNYVLEGRLVVECDGDTVEVGPGEAAQVLAGSAARYSAPVYARMLYVYGPNPEGLASRVLSASRPEDPDEDTEAGTEDRRLH